ncbi:MAG: hypothetical protein KBS52_06180 [Clostridiales bacterium]|nr:hypothetical protein [Candidatus Equinaster intestinalis]
MDSFKKYLAEFIGTFTLVLFTCGPAVFVGGEALSSLWVFILAPLVGGALAALLYKFLASKKEN